MTMAGRQFLKMSGSGNDFIFVDVRHEPAGELADPAVIDALCRRGSGIGADGIVFLDVGASAPVRMTYLNADGSPAALCGNASLCTARLAQELGFTDSAEFSIESDAGVLGARVTREGPEIDLEPITEIRPEAGIPLSAGELRMGFALAGVPHLVVLRKDFQDLDVVGRGRPLRLDPTYAQGANVNFLAPEPAGDGWLIRTYERGVEGETLACGTGAVASAILLSAWGLAGAETRLRSTGGKVLGVRLGRAGAQWLPRLSGEARLVFRGEFGEP
ncbi:MAG: Diaminopimelate epimerase [Gemmatimonadetes bacterium]|nr:Diaminopimelate epimerase [Gemmatimonadota bacterium]